jgi:signal transduction histidine kinase
LLEGLRPLRHESTAENLRESVMHLVNTLTDGTRLQANCLVAEVSSVVSASMETEVLRIIREAVNNVVRHADASEVRVSLFAGGDQLQLCVEDNGRGFVLGQPLAGATFGMTSMRERARQLGGLLWLYSRPGYGTQVNAFFPIPGPSERGEDHGGNRIHSSGHRR